MAGKRCQSLLEMARLTMMVMTLFSLLLDTVKMTERSGVQLNAITASQD